MGATINEKMTAIAEGIRGFTGKADKLTLDDMVQEIDVVYEEGHDTGYTKGVTDGKQAEYDAIWDAIQSHGGRTDYSYCFTGAWTDAVFKPKYPFNKSSKFSYAFQYSSIINLSGYNFLANNLASMFEGSTITFIGSLVIDKSNAVLSRTFYGCSNLKEIELLKFLYEENSIGFTNTFAGCTALERIWFSGFICNSISFSDSSLLDHDTLTRIVNALSPSTSSKVLMLSETAVVNAFGSIDAEEWTTLIATKSNWTITTV